MFTSFDKALVALFGAVAFLAKSYLGLDFGISADTFNTVVALLMPVLVYFIPNKPWTAPAA